MLEDGRPVLVKATSPDYVGLMEAIKADQREVKERQERHRKVAMMQADAGLDTAAFLEDHKPGK